MNNAKAGYILPYIIDIDKDGITEYRFTTEIIVDDLGAHLRFIVYGVGNNGVLIGQNQNALAHAEGDIIEAKWCLFKRNRTFGSSTYCKFSKYTYLVW